jgi:hypothetical protein
MILVALLYSGVENARSLRYAVAAERDNAMQRFWGSLLIIILGIVVVGPVGAIHALPLRRAQTDLTLTPTPVQITVTNEVGANLRSGPGTEYAVITTVDMGAVFAVLTYMVDGKGEIWYLVALPDGESAWIAASVTGGAPPEFLAPVALTPLYIEPTTTPEPTWTPLPPPPLPPGANAWINSENAGVRLRGGPGLHYPELDILPHETPLRLVAPFIRLKYSADEPDVIWYLVKTMDNQYGWVFSGLVGTTLSDPMRPPAEPPPHHSPDAAEIAPPSEIALPGAVLRSARSIYRQGQQLGNHPDRFIVIGDSTSAGNEYTLPAFCAFHWGSYKLGRYESLQTTLDYYAASFCANNLTLRSGFSTAHIFDPLWADPTLCGVGETPLECEYRRSQPAIALIYIGLVDITYSTTDEFNKNLDTMIIFLIEHGVIPVLHTVPSSDRMTAARGYTESMAELNRMVGDAAARYGLPLIDLKRALYDLPNQGCIEEGFHLSYRVDGVLNFTGDELIYGKDLRELLTVQMLDALRVSVMEGEG